MKTLRLLLFMFCVMTLLEATIPRQCFHSPKSYTKNKQINHDSQLSAQKEQLSPIQTLNLTLWCTYQRINLHELSPKEKSEKLQKVFYMLNKFIQSHNIKHVAILILDPTTYDFFDPGKFNEQHKDNFAYWARKIANHATIEAVFNSDSFSLPSLSNNTMWGHFCNNVNHYFNPSNPWGNFLGMQNYPWGNFADVLNKLLWTSITNHQQPNLPLIQGVILHPTPSEKESVLQNLSNALNQFKHNATSNGNNSLYLPCNPCPKLRLSMVVDINQRNFTFANLARFPLGNDIQLNSNGKKMDPPSDFPSKPPYSTTPAWRQENVEEPMLDAVFLDLTNPLLKKEIYQNPKLLTPVSLVEKSLVDTLNSHPTIPGPGLISIPQGSCNIEGDGTYFNTGEEPHKQGICRKGTTIKISPPYLSKATHRKVIHDPTNNCKLTINRAFHIRKDIKQVPYKYSIVDNPWNEVPISESLRKRIFVLFPAECSNLYCFRHLCALSNQVTGLFAKPLFQVFPDGQPQSKYVSKPLALHNLAIFEFTTIPNRSQKNDWKLKDTLQN